MYGINPLSSGFQGVVLFAPSLSPHPAHSFGLPADLFDSCARTTTVDNNHLPYVTQLYISIAPPAWIIRR